jgi:hypothetical protein
VHTLELVAPYAVAIILYLLAPLQSRLVRFAIASAIDRARAGTKGVNNDEIPYHLMPEMIVDYAADAAQVVPALLLPIVGAVYGLSSGVPESVAVTILVVATIAALAMLTWLRCVASRRCRFCRRVLITCLLALAFQSCSDWRGFGE